MRRRVRYDWRMSDFFYNLIKPIWCLFDRNKKSKKALSFKNRQKLYEKGKLKFLKEFDVLSFAKNMRNMKTLVTSMIDDKERFMIKYQKWNSISLLSNTSDGGSDEQYGLIPKVFDKEKKKDFHKERVDEFMVHRIFNLNRRNIVKKNGLGEILDCLMVFLAKVFYQVFPPLKLPRNPIKHSQGKIWPSNQPNTSWVILF